MTYLGTFDGENEGLNISSRVEEHFEYYWFDSIFYFNEENFKCNIITFEVDEYWTYPKNTSATFTILKVW